MLFLDRFFLDITYRLIWVRADDAARDSSKCTDARAEVGDHTCYAYRLEIVLQAQESNHDLLPYQPCCAASSESGLITEA